MAAQTNGSTRAHANGNHVNGAHPPALPTLSQQPSASTTHAPRVLIVGGGPAGLVTLRNYTTNESSHGGSAGLDAVLYERREQIGGVWYLDPDTLGLEKRNGYPSHQWPVESPTNPRFPSPAYPALIGNVYPQFVSFSGAPFPPPQQEEIFPTLDETYRYLTAIAEPLRPRIRTKREVRDVWELPSAGAVSPLDGFPTAGGWLVHTLDHSTTPATSLYEHFDAVTFAPSFTTHANWPDIPGLGDAITRVPRKIHHAKWYRTPEPFWRSKRVVVVGNGLSTNDIAAQIAGRRKAEWGEELRSGEEPILRAIRHEAVEMFPSLPDARIKESPYITRVEVRDNSTLSLTFADGAVVHEVDDLIVGTGYQVGIYDWLRVLRRGASESDVEELSHAGVTLADGKWSLDVARLRMNGGVSLPSLYVPLTPPAKHPSQSKSPLTADYQVKNSTDALDTAYPSRVPHLHNHVLSARNPTLSFSALIVSFAPFVLSDLVSRYIRSVWEGRVTLDANLETRRSAEIERWDLLRTRKAELDMERGQSKSTHAHSLPPSALLAFHILGTSEWPLHQSLHATLLEAKPWLADVQGLRPDEWTEARDEHRRGMYNVKKAWLERKEQARVRAVRAQVGHVASD